MKHTRLATIAILPIAALALAGCGGDGGGGRTARFGSNSNANSNQVASTAKRASTPSELNATTPEASVQRELEKLKEQERRQAKYVTEMRDALAKDSTVIQREENKLRDMRNQIDQFESAQQRYKQALAMERGQNGNDNYAAGAAVRTAGYDNSYPAGTQKASYADYPQNSYQPAPQGNYQNGQQPYQQHEYANQANAGRGQMAPGEEMVYSQPRGNLGGKGFGENPASIPYRGRPQATDEVVWDPPREMFTKNPGMPAPAVRQPAQAQMPMPMQTQPSQNALMNMPPPAAAPRPVQAAAPAPVQPQPAAHADEDTFTPDLFFSGAK